MRVLSARGGELERNFPYGVVRQLFEAELVRALEAEGVSPAAESIGAVSQVGPRAVSRGVLPRLSRLPGTAIRVARTLPILGDGADVARVAALAGVNEPSAADATGDR